MVNEQSSCKADETTTTRISKEIFTERVLPIHKDESWSADLVYKLSLSKKKTFFFGHRYNYWICLGYIINE